MAGDVSVLPVLELEGECANLLVPISGYMYGASSTVTVKETQESKIVRRGVRYLTDKPTYW